MLCFFLAFVSIRSIDTRVYLHMQRGQEVTSGH